MKRTNLICSTFFAASLILSLCSYATAATVTFSEVKGSWRDAVPTGTSNPKNPTITNGTNKSSINWGSGPSGYDFERLIPATQTQLPTPLFNLGTFTHRNKPGGSPSLTSVKLDVLLSFTVDAQTIGPLTFTFSFDHVETGNSAPCQFPDAPNLTPCDDRVRFISSPTPTTFNVNGTAYTLAMSFVDSSGNPVAQYYTQESFNNVATLIGQLTVPAVGGNHAPVALNQSVVTSINVSKAIALVGSDIDGNPLTYSIVSQPLHGTLSGTGANQSYTPASGYVGSDSFTFKVNDGAIDSNVATVSINVSATVQTNTAPVANNQSVSTPESTNKPITILATDANNDPLTYTIVSGPTHGTLTGSGQSRNYSPTAGYNGSDSFTFKANDGTVDSNIATVSINVTAVNDPPVAQDQSVSTNQDTPKTITMVATDPEGSALTYSIVSQPLHGTLSGTGASRNYTPTSCFSGVDSFTFRANDGALNSAIATVSITVNPVARVPASIAISPKNANVNAGQKMPFTYTVIDQCGAFMSGVTVTWQASGGVISATPGASAASFTAPQAVQYITITVTTNNNKSDTAQARIVSADAGASLYDVKLGPVPFKGNSGDPGITFRDLPPDTKIRIFTTSGRLVQTLDVPNGGDQLWDIRNANFDRVASGVYLYMIENGSQKKEGKLVIIQ